MNRLFPIASFVLPFAFLAGCSNSDEAKIYDLKGKIIAVNNEQKTVKIAHEDIPGFMKAMEMDFSVEDAKLLDGLAAGDSVTGKLKSTSGKHVLTELHKSASAAAPMSQAEKADKAAEEAAEIKANLAKLSPEDRKLAEAQKLCPVSNKPLGSMDVPIKLMVKDEPVFICCKGCKGPVEKKPEEFLKKVADLKGK